MQAEVDAVAEADVVSLTEAAENLGVHYMTAYRYVRTGRLAAVKERGQWWVGSADLEAFTASQQAGVTRAVKAVDAASGQPAKRVSRLRYASRLRNRAIAGDDAGAWAIVNEVLTSGAAPSQVHLDVIAPALKQIGDKWASGDLSIAEEHRATAVIRRLVGRMTPMFRHAGRSRATVVIGCVSGDTHNLPLELMADLLHDRNFGVVNLGANTPIEAFLETIEGLDSVAVVGVGGFLDELADVVRDTVLGLRAEYPDLPIVVGGPGGRAASKDLVGVHWGVSSAASIELFESLSAKLV